MIEPVGVPLLPAAAVVVLAGCFQVSAAELLFEFNFNDAGPVTQMSERSTALWELQFEDQAGDPADWHGELGSGVSGLSRDRAFDNRASTGMGSGESGGRALVLDGAFPEVDSLTLSGPGSKRRRFRWGGLAGSSSGAPRRSCSPTLMASFA